MSEHGHSKRILKQLRVAEADDELDANLRERAAERGAELAAEIDVTQLDSRELLGEELEIDWGSAADRGIIHEVTDHRERGRTLRVMVETAQSARMVTVSFGNSDSPDVRLTGGHA